MIKLLEDYCPSYQALGSQLQTPSPVLGDSGAGTLHLSFAGWLPARFCIRSCMRKPGRREIPSRGRLLPAPRAVPHGSLQLQPSPPPRLAPASSSAHPLLPRRSSEKQLDGTWAIWLRGSTNTHSSLCSPVLEAWPVFGSGYLHVAISFPFCLQAVRSVEPFLLIKLSLLYTVSFLFLNSATTDSITGRRFSWPRGKERCPAQDTKSANLKGKARGVKSLWKYQKTALKGLKGDWLDLNKADKKGQDCKMYFTKGERPMSKKCVKRHST